MKTQKHFLPVAMIAGLMFTTTAGFSQGLLTPPGAPAATMKSLAQIEPRTPISSAPFTISSPGSYYLTTNLTGAANQNGISISSGDVTLDLNGFTLSGVASAGPYYSGILIANTYTNIVVRNGTVTGWTNFGVDGYTRGFPRNVIYEHLTLSANGYVGLDAEATSIIRDCLSQNNGSEGFFSVGSLITDCIARDNGSYGFDITDSSMRSCVSHFNWTGVSADHSTVADCDIMNNSTNGLTVGSACHIINNRIADNKNTFYGNGITINGSRNYIGNNAILNNNFALVGSGSAATNNFVVQNKFIGNSGSVISGNNIFPITELPASAGGSFTNANAWVNVFFP